ncbi:MAG: hypothetical protein MK086_11245 [Flavobacteriales bacterium]|nr:hypothetical protein [Flavobacteriales bacterium]
MGLIGVLEGHSSAVYALASNLIDKRVFSGAADNMVGSWNLEEMKPDSFSVKLEYSIFSLLFCDEYLLIGQSAGGVHLIDLNKKRELRHLKFHDLPVFSIINDENRGFHYFLGGDGKLSIVDHIDFSLKLSLPLSDDKLRCGIVRDDSFELFVGSSDGYIRILETTYFNVIFEVEGHPGGVYDMKWLDDENLLTVGRDGHIRRWRFGNGTITHEEAIPAHNYAIYALQFSPSGRKIATCSRDKKVKIWNASDLSFDKRIEREGPTGHTHSVNTVMWYDENTLLSAGDDRKILVWNLKDS